MPFYLFVWDDDNEEHLAEHGVTPEEFAEVVCNPDRTEKSQSSGRPMAFGPTSTGKYWRASTSSSTRPLFMPSPRLSPRRSSMTRREARHVRRELSPAERIRVAEGRRLVAAETDEIRRKAREYKVAYDAGQAALEQALQLLKAERQQQGLSLADIEDRAGISRPNLSRLENEAEANPTVATLTRYANALGKKLMIVLTDQK
jgi:hypothetical protein